MLKDASMVDEIVEREGDGVLATDLQDSWDILMKLLHGAGFKGARSGRLLDELDDPELYHFEAWKDDPEGLVAEFVKLQDFYRQAAARGLAIVYYAA